MNTWARHLDDLAAATAHLLIDGAVQPQPLVNPNAAMAARDAVVVELRQLIGSVGDAPRFATVRELTLHDVVHRPAQALHQTLSELPRAVPFGSGELGAADDGKLTAYERAWQQAARATIGLEAYVDVLRELPDSDAWSALRGLTDVAAALPYLDHDLSEAVRPRLTSGEDWGLPYRMLTHPGHDALRVVSGEVRARVPAAEPPSSAAHAQAGDPQLVYPSSQALGQLAATRPTSAHDARQSSSGRVAGGPHLVGDLAEAMTRYTYAVSARGANLSVADVKGVRRLLEYGSLHAAAVLERAAPAVAGAAEAARALRATAASADRLREAPARSMTAARVELAASSKDLMGRTSALAGQAAHLPEPATPRDLRRLAAPAVAFAQSVPALAGALDLSVREALAARLMLVPGTTSEHSTNTISWVTATMGGPDRDCPPAVAAGAEELSMTARRVAPAVRQVGEDLARHAAVLPTPTQQAMIAARRHVGVARVELRQALADRTARQPGVLAAQLPSHPRLAPPPRMTGPQR